MKAYYTLFYYLLQEERGWGVESVCLCIISLTLCSTICRYSELDWFSDLLKITMPSPISSSRFRIIRLRICMFVKYQGFKITLQLVDWDSSGLLHISYYVDFSFHTILHHFNCKQEIPKRKEFLFVRIFVCMCICKRSFQNSMLLILQKFSKEELNSMDFEI